MFYLTNELELLFFKILESTFENKCEKINYIFSINNDLPYTH